MAYTPRSGSAVISMGVDGAATSRKDIDSVGDALDRLNGTKFQQLTDQVAGIQSHIGSLKSTITDLAQLSVAGFSIGAFAGMVKGAIDAADNLNDLSKTTSITLADLSGLKLAAEQSGGDLEGIASSINKLSMAMGKDAERFAQLGVTAKDPIEAFKQLSDVVSAIDDPQVRAAISAATLGRSWESAAPLLAEGSKNIGEMIDKGRELAGVNQEMADKADKFNDQLALMGTAVDGVKMKLADQMLPALVDITEQMSSAYREAGALQAVLMGLNSLGAFAFSDEFASPEVQIKNLRAELDGMGADLELSRKGSPIGAIGRWMFGETTDALEVKAEAIRAQIWALEEEAARPARQAAAKGEQDAKDKAAREAAAAAAAAKAAEFLKNQSATEKAAREYETALKASQAFLDALKLETAQIGMNADQIKLNAAARAAAKAPTADLAAGIRAAAQANVAAAKAQRELEESNKRAREGAAAWAKIQQGQVDLSARTIQEAVAEADKNEELARTYGLTRAAIEELQLARLEEQLAQRASNALTLDEIATLEQLIAAKRRNAAALGTIQTQDAGKKAAEEWKRQAESIESSLTDALMRGFEKGSGFGRNLVETLKNMFGTLVLRPIISAIVNPVAGAVTGALGMSGAASAATGGGSALGSIGSGVGMAGMFGSIATGGMQTAGAFLTGQIGFGSTLSAGAAAVGTGTMSGITAGLSSIVGVLGPIALGIGAAVAIWKKLDTSGTSHTGGAASASSAGVSTIRAESIGFEHTKTNAEAEKFVAGLASGVVNILDTTALAFGKTAGYTAATAFADDTSKDGAWGALLIQKMGSTVLDWNSTRSSKWAPKEFADGEAGQKQYLAALSASVRSALDGIGLPAWAKTMLDGVGAGASIEDLAKVVEQINLTQRALAAMKDQLPGFASMTEAATSALMAASGGIEALAGNAGAYFANFFSDGERSAATMKQVGEALATVGVQLPATREAFRAEVDARIALGEAGAPATAMLLKVAGAFAEMVPPMEATVSAARTAADILSERTALQKEYDDLVLTSVQKMSKDRAALAPDNRLLFDQVQAARRAKDAQDAARASLGELIDRMGSFGDSAASLRDSLQTGTLSTLTPEQQYAQLRSQYESTTAAARSGDAKAQADYSSIATAFLTASQKINGGDAQYSADFASVYQTSEQIAQWAAGQVDVAQASLDALNHQVIGIAELNTTMAQVAQDVRGFPAAMAAASAQAMAPVNFSAMGTSGMTSLVTEIKALRAANDAMAATAAAMHAELKGLRGDQNQQTGDLITSSEKIAVRSSAAIVDELASAKRHGKTAAGPLDGY
ncbi:MAG TPA: hypothetical protein VF861_14475 [Telluria sp.]